MSNIVRILVNTGVTDYMQHSVRYEPIDKLSASHAVVRAAKQFRKGFEEKKQQMGSKGKSSRSTTGR